MNETIDSKRLAKQLLVDANRLATLDEEFAKYREQTEAKHRRMRNVVNEIHKIICTGAGCPVCKAVDE